MATSAIKSDIYNWSGTDKTGRTSKGEIEAASQAMAKAQLRQQGIKPKTLRPFPAKSCDEGPVCEKICLALRTVYEPAELLSAF